MLCLDLHEIESNLMSTVKVKGVGYCVVRQAIHIDADKPTHIITGVFGLFDTIDESEEFIFSSSDAPVRHTKTEHSYTDGEHYYTISTVRHPQHHEKHRENQCYAVMVTEGKFNRYLSKEFFDKVINGDVVTSFPPRYLQIEAHSVNDERLAKEAFMLASSVLHNYSKVKLKVISI